jgi:hypothetical protein
VEVIESKRGERMKFIKFADTLLNLEQVALIDKVVKDIDKGPFHVEVWLLNVGMKTTISETFQTIAEMLDRFDELSNMLIGTEPVGFEFPKTTVSDFLNPDFVGKNMTVYSGENVVIKSVDIDKKEMLVEGEYSDFICCADVCAEIEALD